MRLSLGSVIGIQHAYNPNLRSSTLWIGAVVIAWLCNGTIEIVVPIFLFCSLFNEGLCCQVSLEEALYKSEFTTILQSLQYQIQPTAQHLTPPPKNLCIPGRGSKAHSPSSQILPTITQGRIWQMTEAAPTNQNQVDWPKQNLRLHLSVYSVICEVESTVYSSPHPQSKHMPW